MQRYICLGSEWIIDADVTRRCYVEEESAQAKRGGGGQNVPVGGQTATKEDDQRVRDRQWSSRWAKIS